jgi:hypothetical protein
MSLPPIFFVHVMKTAGTAVSTLLRPHYKRSERYPRIELGKVRNQKLLVNQLMDIPSEEQVQTRFYSVHMAAWTAHEVAPQHIHVSVLREPVARTISHLRHIARGLNIESLEEIYDDPRWRIRLNDYQTQLFSMRSADYHKRRNAWDEAVAKAVEAAAGNVDQDRKESPSLPAWLEETGMNREMYTGMFEARPQTEKDFAAAIEMVD